MIAGSVPILSCDAARDLEKSLFAGDEAKEWPAMQRAGRALATAVLRDFAEIGGFPAAGRVLVLVGKGHNGGDALIAARAIRETFPAARLDVLFVFGERTLRPLAARAWRELSGCGVPPQDVSTLRRDAAATTTAPYDLCLDGVFGFQFRPPADARATALFAQVNALPIRLRAAVDLPSAGLFRADFTYATGSVKSPLLGATHAGRVRYLDLGFFLGGEAGNKRVLTPALLGPLGALRPFGSDKRTYGHVFIVGGSRSYPGAVLMTVLAALRSGAGLVTAFVPESVAAAFAARAPEAMWVAWPETPTGGLALEGEHLLRAKLARASALVIGPGLGREPETLALAAQLAKTSPVPLVLDADALQPDIVVAGDAPRIVTPHAGEFARIREAIISDQKTTVVLKGPVTELWQTTTPTYHSFFGGPVLARGGSGDLLAGLIGGQLAQLAAERPRSPSASPEAGKLPAPSGSVSASATLLAAARGVVWHGLAADQLARTHGQVAVNITQLLDFLPAALKESAHEQ